MNEPAVKPPASADSAGFLAAVTSLLSTLVGMIYTRLELVFLELEEGLSGLLGLLLWAFVALFAASAGLFIGALALIFAFWDSHRVLVSVLVMGGFLALALAALLVLRAKIQRRRAFFDTTLNEFAKDREFFKVRP